jgi:hypothetical protein
LVRLSWPEGHVTNCLQGYNTDEIVNGIGSEHPPAANPCGPTITGVIDNRGPETSPNVLDGYVIEEGAIPQALAPIMQAMLDVLPNKEYPDPFPAAERLRHLFSATKSRFAGPYYKGGSVNRTQTYLIMSHDSNEAILTLENNKPYLQFLGVGRTEHVKKLNEVLAKATKAIGGTLVNSPFHAGWCFALVKNIAENEVCSFPPARRNHGSSARRRYYELRRDRPQRSNRPFRAAIP